MTEGTHESAIEGSTAVARTMQGNSTQPDTTSGLKYVLATWRTRSQTQLRHSAPIKGPTLEMYTYFRNKCFKKV
jgi:hypothetical protein